ncbi:YitT family protein [Paenibacillus sp. JX-17]|uniref:YitT family protein n=1 Tax=Paenibacillus lacisoli TaxID=3064525 RepID=A0ABT9C9M5_9BACL|nr:YitT family protein [Paenibacillus sp. JX-17]MDO7905364.1 YitT family protein [Paenibacillus sp. JX-17]
MPRTHRKTSFLTLLYRFVFLTIGSVLAAVGLDLFLVPNEVLDGGITGLSIVLNNVTSLPLGVFLFVLNIPFVWLGYKQIGKTFAISSLYGIIVLSVTTSLLHHYEAFTHEKILAVLFGGLILGIGVGIVIRFGGSTDGVEISAILLNKKLKLPVGQIVMFINIFIFIIAGFVMGWDSAMYSIFTYYLASKVMDIVVEGINDSKSVTVISAEYEEISQAIMDRLGRSTTYIYGRGGYSKEDTQIVYCVVTRLEVAKLKGIVHEIDPNAFIAIEHVADVLGGGFEKKDIH